MAQSVRNRERMGFLIDSSKCTGCKTCEMACRNSYCLGSTPSYRRVFEFSGGNWHVSDKGFMPDVFSYYVSVSCNHCESPACEQVCPSGAMRKHEDGYVVLDSTVCIGCKNCSFACPYGAPSYSSSLGRMRKCDGCRIRVEEGMNPLCVDACPMRALEYGPIDEFMKRPGAVRMVAPLPSPDLTDPNLVVIGHPKSKAPLSDAGKIANLKEVCQ